MKKRKKNIKILEIIFLDTFYYIYKMLITKIVLINILNNYYNYNQ